MMTIIRNVDIKYDSMAAADHDDDEDYDDASSLSSYDGDVDNEHGDNNRV